MLQLLLFSMTTLLEHSASETKMLRTPDSRKTNLTKPEDVRSTKLMLEYCEKATKFEKISTSQPLKNHLATSKKQRGLGYWCCSGAQYRVDQQCCPRSRGWSLDFFAKSLVIPTIYTLNLWRISLNFITSDYQWSCQKIQRVVSRWSPGGLRTNSAVTTLLVHTVCLSFERTIVLSFESLGVS